MRISVLDTNQTLGARVKLRLMSLVSGRRAPDVVRTILYRPELFGKAFTEMLHPAMRDESRWSVGERELFAAFTSRLNQCPF